MALADTARLIASLELQDKFSGPARNVEGSMGRLESRAGNFGRIGGQVSSGLSSLATNVVRFGVVAGGVLAGGLAISIKAASDLNEEIDKSKVVFGPAADEMIAFADGAAKIGLTKAEALGAAGAFGNMFNTIGFAQDESQDMSETMVQLAADMASFNNEDPSEMLDKLRSGLAGEAEPLRRFGVLLSEAEVKAFAYANGIAESGEALTETQKVQARYGLILEQTEIQQGNFEDTSKSLANQQRILRSNLSNTAATIGTAFLPAVSRVLEAVNELFIDKQPQIEAFGEKLGASLETALSSENIDRGMDRISGFIDNLAEGGEFDMSSFTGRFSSVIDGVSGLPWESIGNAATLLGTGSKAMLDAFLGLPGWVQTAVLTGWGLNKLTGGAVGSIVGSLGKGLFGQLRGSTPATPMYVTQVGGIPGGGPVGVGGKGGGFNPLSLLLPVFAAQVASEIEPILPSIARETKAALGIEQPIIDLPWDLDELQWPLGPKGAPDWAKFDQFGGKDPTTMDKPTAPPATAEEIDASIARIDAELNDHRPLLEGINFNTNIRPKLEEQKRELITSKGYMARAAANTRDAIPWLQRNRDAIHNFNASEGRRFGTTSGKMDRANALNATQATRLDNVKSAVSGQTGVLTQIRDKKASFIIKNEVTVKVSATVIQKQLTDLRSTIGGGGFI